MNFIKQKKILIIEDDDAFDIWINLVLDRLEFENYHRVKTAEEALIYLSHNHIDLIICDIFLEGKLTGVDFLKHVQHYSIPIIIITSSTSISLYREIQTIDSVIYLVKPFQPITFIAAIESLLIGNNAQYITNKLNEPFTFVRMPNNKQAKIYFNDIQYLESDGNYTYLFTQEKKIAIRKSISRVLDELDQRFVRCHRTYAVNKQYIIARSTSQIDLQSRSLPLGRSYQKLFENEIKL